MAGLTRNAPTRPSPRRNWDKNVSRETLPKDMFAGIAGLDARIVFASHSVTPHVAWRPVNAHAIRRTPRSRRSEKFILLPTFLTGVFSLLNFAVTVRVAVSLAVFLKDNAQQLVVVGAPAGADGRRIFRKSVIKDLPECSQIRMMRIEGSLLFASVEDIEREFDRIEALAATRQSRFRSPKAENKINLASADFLIERAKKTYVQGRNLNLIVVAAPTLRSLDRLGVKRVFGEERTMRPRPVPSPRRRGRHLRALYPARLQRMRRKTRPFLQGVTHG